MARIQFDPSIESRIKQQVTRFSWSALHIDGLLFLGLLFLGSIGLFILYSATNESTAMTLQQATRLGFGFLLMLLFAQIPARFYQQWVPWLYILVVCLLLAVLLIGHVGQGARRWLVLGPLRFQPSEFMKIILPMTLAWLFDQNESPPSAKIISIATLILLVPCLLTAKQPDLGTAMLIGITGVSVIILAGMRWRILFAALGLALLSTPLLWHFMHTYQKERVLIFLNPERAPLGAGYHIIQSKIAIGSGGILGKGWLHGTQSHLSFLPAHTTDFIFAVGGEELGLIGCSIILLVYFLIFSRALYISMSAQRSFTRLLSGALSIMFMISAIINIGMVIGILPVVGVPLPLISYGGSSIVTIMVSFGIIMSIHTRKQLW